jgi:5-methyltetrahydropteroyltriglutamate--homocysteine methyltransferase
MKRSTERILTTHTGSLPRPEPLQAALAAIDRGAEPDLGGAQWEELVRDAVAEVVARQRAAGVDVVSDGEMSKVSYSTYITQRADGFGGSGAPIALADAEDFPEWGGPALAGFNQVLATPACVADVVYRDTRALEADIANLTAALERDPAPDALLSAASPGVIALFLENQHYPSHEAYLRALGEAMKDEYDAVHRAGFVLQLDCPDLAVGRHMRFGHLTRDEWRETIRLHVDVLNDATRDIPPDAMRLHLCWGNYEGPHTRDVPLDDVLDIALQARPAAISFEAANPRHAHEWRLFERHELPADKVLIPGVIDPKTSYVEHPELVCQRIVQFAELVGRERVLAGTDCGFATFAGFAPVVPEIVYAKLGALAEGAELATRELWS